MGVLPRLFKIKYDSGVVEELLFVDVPQERRTAGGGLVVEYEQAIQQSVFEQLRVVRTGRLKVAFSNACKVRVVVVVHPWYTRTPSPLKSYSVLVLVHTALSPVLVLGDLRPSGEP